jgi:aspartokinase-like uncharacterized kinase
MNVVKVGGSLFDHPALGPGLRQWLGEQRATCLLVPGGGAAADVVRTYHRTHHLREEASHWLAIQMMSVNAELLEAIIARAAKVVDACQFCRRDEGNVGSLSHDWRVTSDAIAARIAETENASKLILLKSVDETEGISWAEAADRGLVDRAFGEVVERAGLDVEWINFRKYLDGLRLLQGNIATSL